MATIRQRKSGSSWEIIIRKKGVLDKPHYASADSYEDAVLYAETIEGLLHQGIIPEELQYTPEKKSKESIEQWARAYMSNIAISDSDTVLLNSMLDIMKLWAVDNVTMEWAHDWIKSMKQKENLSPSSIRHKVGAVARMLDWQVTLGNLSINPLRMLPKRYASYAAGDGNKRVDIERERRISDDEEKRIRLLLSGKVPEGKQRGILKDDLEDWILIFTLALETAMRLRELYTLSWQQVDLDKKTIFLDKTKNGDKRQVPLSSVALNCLVSFPRKNDQFVFPWWNGQQSSLKKVTRKLSQKFSRISRYSECDDLRFHDLRHEAVCRFYERTTLSDLQIAKITGHKDLRMLKRYANLRGSDLAELLW